ncbi:PqqD family peptide modification chaperone [Elusimicrobiota bacterium]
MNYPVIDKNILLKKKGNSGAIFSIYGDHIGHLNETGCFIWGFLNGMNSKQKIVDEIMKEYQIEKKSAEKELESFLEQLKDKRLLIDISALRELCFAVTGRCNLKCKHCFAKDTWGNVDLSTEEILEIADQIIEAGVKSVSLFGGETLLREDIFTIIERFKGHPVHLSVNTNATLISDEMAERFKRVGIKVFIVSLDGASSKIHDKQRGQGSFDKTMEGIKNLLKYDRSVTISFIVTKINEKEIEKIAELGCFLGVSGVRFNHIMHTGNAICYENEIFIDPVKDVQNCKRVYKLNQEYGDFISGSYLQEYEKIQKIDKHKIEKDRIKVNPCGAAVNRCAIRPDGWVVPCEVMWEAKAGNIRETKLVDIWKSSELLNEFRVVRYIDLKEFPQCSGCEYQYLCFHGHRCAPYYYPGGLDNRKLYCYREYGGFNLSKDVKGGQG